jgi:hypothetical protein
MAIHHSAKMQPGQHTQPMRPAPTARAPRARGDAVVLRAGMGVPLQALSSRMCIAAVGLMASIATPVTHAQGSKRGGSVASLPPPPPTHAPTSLNHGRSSSPSAPLN